MTMGLFSSLFGSGGSDKADQLRQQAYNAFSSIKTPELAALQVQLNNYVNAGQITPEQAEATLLGSNAFNSIATDPSNTGAMKQALSSLQNVGTSGGLTAIDKAQLQNITDQQNQQNQSQNAATMQQAQQRGVGGSSLNTVNQLLNEQGNANRASEAGTQVAANAQARALQAMQGAGQLGSQMEAQQYGEQANKAQAQNAIDLFNTQTQNQSNLYNTQTANAAQAANLANQQAINNANTATQNAGQQYNAQQNQTVYNDALQKAQGQAGILGNWANTAQQQANNEVNGSAGLISGALQGGAQALGASMGGPAGASAASSMAPHAPPSYAPQNESEVGYGFSDGGAVPDCSHPDHPDHMAMGGQVHCYAYGGDVHHHPDCYMATGGFLSGLKKGELHKDLGVPQGEKIPAKKIEKATHSDNETLRKRAQFAENAKHWHHGKDGGEVPGKAKVEGDSPKNDTVDAKLSPGEVVAPRSAMQDDEEFDKFMEKYRPSNQKKMAMGGMVPEIPRVADNNPMRDVARAPISNPVPLPALNDANKFKQSMTAFKPHGEIKAPSTDHLVSHALVNLQNRVSKLEE